MLYRIRFTHVNNGEIILTFHHLSSYSKHCGKELFKYVCTYVRALFLQQIKQFYSLSILNVQHEFMQMQINIISLM